jgi:CBS domain-containing protein
MTQNPVTLLSQATVAQALESIAPYDYSTYPVTDAQGCYLGMISEARLRRTMAAGNGQQRIGQLLEPREHVFPDDSLVRAAVRINRSGERQLAVLAPHDRQQLIGLLTITDIVRAQALAAQEVDDSHRTSSPDISGRGQ